MKNTCFLAVLIFLALGCQEEVEPVVQEEPQVENTSIIATWKIVDWFGDTPRDINDDGESSTDYFSQWDGCKKQSLLVLSEDNSGKIVYTGESNNPRCPEGFETNDFFTLHPWLIDTFNQDIYFNLIADDYIDAYKIVELNSETLILEGADLFTCCSYSGAGYLKFKREE